LDHATLSLLYERYLSAALDYDTQLQYFDKGIEAFKTTGNVHPLLNQHNQFWLKKGKKRLLEPKIIHFYDPEKE
jgi:hypothetical protein